MGVLYEVPTSTTGGQMGIFYRAKVELTGGKIVLFEGKEAHALLYQIDQLHGNQLRSLDLRKYERGEDGVAREAKYDPFI